MGEGTCHEGAGGLEYHECPAMGPQHCRRGTKHGAGPQACGNGVRGPDWALTVDDDSLSEQLACQIT